MLDERGSSLAGRVRKVLATMPEDVQATVEAQMAISAAQEIDAGRQLSIAPVMKELRTLMELLRSWAAAATETGDDVDELARARAERRANTAS